MSAGYRMMRHPDAPTPKPVVLRGKYAIRKDGMVMINTPTLNARTDLEFVDDLPDFHVDAIRNARIREEAAEMAREEYRARAEERLRLAEEKTHERIKNTAKTTLESGTDSEATAKSEKFIIVNAKSVTDLADFVQKTYGVKLDRRKNLDTLRVEADELRKAKAAK